MRPRTIPTLFALALAATTVAGTAAATVRVRERSDRDADARGIRVLQVDNARGDVEVTPSPDGRIHVTAIKTCRGRDAQQARRHAGEVTVTAGPKGDVFVVRVTYPRRVDIQVNFWDVISGRSDEEDFGPSHDVRLLLSVPATLDLQLASVSGDLVVRDITGTQRLNTTSGDCAVTGATGKVEIRTVSGDARLAGAARATVRTTSGDIEAQPRGPLQASTVSGDIDVEGAPDSLSLGTTSGDISVDDAPRGLRAETVSGSIRVARAGGAVELESGSGGISAGIGEPLRGVTISSSSGSVRITADPGLDASLELKTSSGDIECDVPLVLLGHGRQYLNAKLGRGGAIVKARTVSGDLHVTSGGR